ncbi:SPOR domain-containing protein [Sphingobacterium spiritivorum]|uniref:SPOR domain-containing protein n=1 Tax=Sphingobacterium spiritivorum TaxID=258 RepID=UPI0021628744|nr:SPOR domain-containing protein [Sphingobacterium spiritivorum]
MKNKVFTMYKKGLILFFLMFGCAVFAKAQQSGRVEVFKDSLISVLQAYRSEEGINPSLEKKTVSIGKTSVVDKSKMKRVKVRGFRVQIFSGASRNEAYAEQGRFKNLYKEYEAYVNYDEPNYRVKVGDFTSRSEANNLMRILRSQFDNVFVFTEDVYVYR